MKRTLLLLLSVGLLIGCSQYEEAKKKGDGFYEEEKYEEAAEAYKLAISEKADENLKKRIDDIQLFFNLTDFIEQEKYDKANQLLLEFKEADVAPPLKNNLQEQSELVNQMIEEQDDIRKKLIKVEVLIESEQLKEAKELLNKLDKDSKRLGLGEEHENLLKTIGKKENEFKKEKEAERKEELQSMKEYYLALFNDMEIGDEQTFFEAGDGPTSTLSHLIYEAALEWDENLTEIYSLLKEYLPEKEFSKLKADQLAWVESKEAKINDDSISFDNAGQAGAEVRANIFYNETKDRCYLLVNTYFD